jgi:hypothetical protein
MVRAMAAYGIPQLDIACVIGISDKTLRLAFRDELDKAGIEANAKVAEICFKMATSGKVPAATFFWLKTRAGWREVIRQEHSGPDGGPIQSQQFTEAFAKLETIELQTLIRIYRKAGLRLPGE